MNEKWRCYIEIKCKRGMECKWGIWMNPEKLEYDFNSAQRILRRLNAKEELQELECDFTFTFWWSDEEKIQAVNGSHVVQAHPVVVKTYKLYIHTIQFCTQDIVVRSKTSLRYIQEISLNLPWKRTISKLRLQIKQESLYPEIFQLKEMLSMGIYKQMKK